ncbi:MAG: single-stranded DNA-binding protein [Clostridia bacterium]|nr:single-stranded DNA-binding protein [Clostridia bacterium]
MNFEQMNNNKVYIAGIVASKPQFSYEVFGEGFYEFNLEVKRLSDASDLIPITISERLLKEQQIEIGSKLAGAGQFRSYNKLEGEKSKLMLTVFIRELLPFDETLNPNQIELTGFVCKEPIYRTTPFKREITDVLIAVNRSYNKSDYLPCIAWGRNAKFVKNLSVGDKLNMVGRIQSRVYQKKIGDQVLEKVAFEISLSKITKVESDALVETINYNATQNYYAN